MNYLYVVSTIILVIWAAIGPLVGVRYGNELSKRERLRDSEAQEFREVLKSLTSAFSIMLGCAQPLGAQTLEDQQELSDAEKVSLETLRNCLYIAESLKKSDISDRWIKILEEFEQKGDRRILKKQFEELEAEVRKLACKSIS